MTVHLGRLSHTESGNVGEEQNAFLGKSLNFRYLTSVGEISAQSHVIREKRCVCKYTKRLTHFVGLYMLYFP